MGRRLLNNKCVFIAEAMKPLADGAVDSIELAEEFTLGAGAVM